MSCVYVTSDWHLGHKNICNFRKEFGTIDEHDGLILENYCLAVNKRDIVWFLGDICFDQAALATIKHLTGNKRLVLGNHCTDSNKRPTIAQLNNVFTSIHGLVKYKRSWLSHAPIHPAELRDKINVHGHVHPYSIDDNRYFNACLENTEYKPIKYQEILERVNDKSDS